MAQRLSLPYSFLDSAHCIAAIDALYALYLKKHRRAPTIELLSSSYRDSHTIVIYADASPEHAAQVDWFTTNLNALYPPKS